MLTFVWCKTEYRYKVIAKARATSKRRKAEEKASCKVFCISRKNG
jgi:hypothetical protein